MKGWFTVALTVWCLVAVAVIGVLVFSTEAQFREQKERERACHEIGYNAYRSHVDRVNIPVCVRIGKDGQLEYALFDDVVREGK